MEATQTRPMGGKQKEINVGRTERNASMVGGAALALSGLTTIAKRRLLPGLAMMAAGGMLMYRGKTGHCDIYESIGLDTGGSEDHGLTVEKFLTVNRLPQDVYEFWRHLENLPSFMRHLASVEVTGERTSHWKAAGPGGISVEWDAEIVEDYPGQLIQWHSVGDAEIPNEGLVEFREAPGGRGTEVKVTIRYYPPGGAAGKIAAKVAHALNAMEIEEDLKRLKQILETGETATAARSNGHH
ncbi:SRPBCC family protein [Geomesophilobacter sediminis]|nr:SRPBCC family protein [Geomesophilobacter sediminis]